MQGRLIHHFLDVHPIEEQIRHFLSTGEPEVLCVSGHWGVGKTYAWNKYLKDALAKDGIALKRYSYVSLFGVNSLDELKYSIFENSVKSSDIGVDLTLEALASNISAASERFVRKTLNFRYYCVIHEELHKKDNSLGSSRTPRSRVTTSPDSVQCGSHP